MITTGKELLLTEDLLETVENGLKSIEYQNFGGRIHASSSGYCARRGALEATYTGDKEFEATSALYFKLGIALEEAVLDSLNKQKRLFFSQYHLPETPINLGGKVDGITLYNGKLHTLEIKSCGTLPTKPSLEYLSQLYIYSAVTGLPGLLLYVSRHVQDYKTGNSLKMKYFDMGFNLAESKRVIKSCATAYFCSKNGLLPEIPEYITSEKDCGYCYFKDRCWGMEMPHLEPMTEIEDKHIAATVDKFTEHFMSPDEIKKRRNGVLKYLSKSGNKNAQFYLDGEDWSSFLIDF